MVGCWCCEVEVGKEREEGEEEVGEEEDFERK